MIASLFDRVLSNKIYLLKYFSFLVVSISGLVRSFAFSFEELGLWREVGALFVVVPLILLFGIPNYIVINANHSQAKSIAFFLVFLLLTFFVGQVIFLHSTGQSVYYSFITLMGVEIVLSNFAIKESKLRVLLTVQTIVALFELLALLVAIQSDFTFEEHSIYYWMCTKTIIVSCLVLHNLDFRFVNLTNYLSLAKIKASSQFFFSCFYTSVKNNYLPMVIGSVLMNFDGIFLSKFFSKESMGVVALLIFFRSIFLIPQTLAGQKISPKLHPITKNSLVLYKSERINALIFMLPMLIPCSIVFFLLISYRGGEEISWSLFALTFIYSAFITCIGPVQTFLQVLKKGTVAFLIDLMIILLLAIVVIINQSAITNFQLIALYFFAHLVSYIVKYFYMIRMMHSRDFNGLS